MSNTEQKKDNGRRKPSAVFEDPKKTAKKEGGGSTRITAAMMDEDRDLQEKEKRDPLEDILKKTKLPPIKITWAMEKLSVSYEGIMDLIASKKLAREGEGISGESFFNYYRFLSEQKSGQTDKNECESVPQPRDDIIDSPLLDIVHTKSGYKITHKKEQLFHVNIVRDGTNRIINILEV